MKDKSKKSTYSTTFGIDPNFFSFSAFAGEHIFDSRPEGWFKCGDSLQVDFGDRLFNLRTFGFLPQPHTPNSYLARWHLQARLAVLRALSAKFLS